MRVRTAPANTQPVMHDVKTLAAMLSCSTRHLRRLRDSGRMPAPVRLGSLLRWRVAEIEAWVAGGCQPSVPGPTREGVTHD